MRQVLCMPRNQIEPPRGVWKGPRCFRAPLIGYCAFQDKIRTEADLFWVQVISYTVIADSSSVFVYRRGTEGERRLDPYWSIGVGGHVEKEDCPDTDLACISMEELPACLRRAALRELHEELGLPKTAPWYIKLLRYFRSIYKVYQPNPCLNPQGVASVPTLIYDTSNEVGLAHLGYVSVCSPIITETLGNTLGGKFVSWGEAEALNLEPWSRLLLMSRGHVWDTWT